MTNSSTIKKYELLSLKIGRENAKNLNKFIESKIKDEFKKETQLFATSQDLAKLKNDIVFWLFICWIAQTISTFGFIFLFLKK